MGSFKLIHTTIAALSATTALACGAAPEDFGTEEAAPETAEAVSPLITRFIADNKNLTWCNEAFLNHLNYWDTRGTSPYSDFYVNYLSTTFVNATGYTLNPEACTCTQQPPQPGGGSPGPMQCRLNSSNRIADIHIRDTQTLCCGYGRTTQWLQTPPPSSGLRKIVGADIDFDINAIISQARALGVTTFQFNKYVFCHELGNALGLEDTPGSASCMNTRLGRDQINNFAFYSADELRQLRNTTGTGSEL